MAVLLLVVDGRAALHHLLQFRCIEDFVPSRRAPDLFGERERRASVAIRHADQGLARFGIKWQSLVFDRLGACQQLLDRDGIKRLEHHHPCARQQRRDQLERRILRRRPDEDDRAVLDNGQKRVLLCPVEAVNLIHKQQGSPPDLAARTRGIEHLLEIGDPGKDRRNLLEVQVGRLRQQAGDRGLAGAGRPTEEERAEAAGIEQARERAVRTEQMILAHDFVEAPRPQLVGERAWRIALEPGGCEKACPPALGAWGHPRNSMNCCWPSRTNVMRQSRLCWPPMRRRSRVLVLFALLTESTRSPRWNPRLCAGEPFATSTTTTPCTEASSCSSSASTGDRLETRAPWNGEGDAMTSSS